VRSPALQPEGLQHLGELMAAGESRGEKISAVDLRRINRILALVPEDMTVTVEAGLPLHELQKALAAHGQWLPIDPPKPERLSIHELLAFDLSGPRRFGYGTIREHLIGMKVMLADGRTIQSGGKVVKNVAGYDLAKLFIGARDSLGIIVEATFKVRPLPEVERLTGRPMSLAEVGPALRAILDSELTPIIVDCHRLGDAANISLVLGVAGTRQEVAWQLERAAALGFQAEATLDYEREFWNNPAPVNRISVLPTRVVETIGDLGTTPFVARAGNGVIFHRGETLRAKDSLPLELMRRVKAAYDPKNLLPEFRT
jgi:FAD/FMN-containing dehydrogenase